MRKFPPKPRLLTSEEFHEQGLLETTRALEELKTYCSSPESKPWRMMTRLKDPQRYVYGDDYIYSAGYKFTLSLFTDLHRSSKVELICWTTK